MARDVDHLATARSLAPYRVEGESAVAHALIAVAERLDKLIEVLESGG